ncbi:nose resistant to fluoxetine protein 6-like isoform X2 [Ornithodoros turicata]
MAFLGYFSECLNAILDSEGENVSSSGIGFSSGYCLSTVNLTRAQKRPPLNISDYTWKKMMSDPGEVMVGLCLPTSCSSEDVTRMFDLVLEDVVRGANVSTTTCYPNKEPFSGNVGGIAVSATLLFIVLLVTLGTLYDIFGSCRPWKKNPTSSTSVDTTMASNEGLVDNQGQQGSTVGRVLLSFSMVSNGSKILRTGGTAESISVLHGLRFYSMAYIILAHSYSFAAQWITYRNPDDMKVIPANFVEQGLANGTFSVDTFFFIAGLLIVYVTLKRLDATGGKMNWAVFYLHRYIRMTPLMMAVIGICATVLPYMGDGPRWRESIATYDVNCRKNWWINAIYLQNFVHRPDMCLNHTWYSAVDFQLYIISPVLLYALYKSRRYGIGLIGAVLFASITATGVIIGLKKYPPMPYISNILPVEEMNEYFADVYIKPYCRIGPFLIGMLTGYAIHVTKGSIILRKGCVACGWIACTCLMLFVLYAMWPANTGHALPPPLWAAIYGALARTVWSIGLSWIVLACLAGYGGFVNTILSWKAIVPFSKLTYGAYIVHPVLIAMFYGSREGVFEYSTYLVTYFALGNVIITYAASFLICLIFEAPVIGLERIIFSYK